MPLNGWRLVAPAACRRLAPSAAQGLQAIQVAAGMAEGPEVQTAAGAALIQESHTKHPGAAGQRLWVACGLPQSPHASAAASQLLVLPACHVLYNCRCKMPLAR